MFLKNASFIKSKILVKLIFILFYLNKKETFKIGRLVARYSVLDDLEDKAYFFKKLPKMSLRLSSAFSLSSISIDRPMFILSFMLISLISFFNILINIILSLIKGF